MKKLAKRFLNQISPKYRNYTFLILKNSLINTFFKKSSHKFLFILSPPYCGSTLLNEIISTSPAVSVNNTRGTREGQRLPSVRRIMFDHDRAWDSSVDFDWNYIKSEWIKYWDLRHPILLEKSPSSIVRARSIELTFQPSYFIIFYRNPYAHCESMIRRNNYEIKEAAKFAIKCLSFQKQNLNSLENTIPISYEQLTENPSSAVRSTIEALPEMKDMNFNQKFSAHNYLEKKMKIKNLNQEKIDKLSKEQITIINEEFKDHTELLAFFNYRLILQPEK